LVAFKKKVLVEMLVALNQLNSTLFTFLFNVEGIIGNISPFIRPFKSIYKKQTFVLTNKNVLMNKKKG
jgi:hypothetical protein